MRYHRLTLLLEVQDPDVPEVLHEARLTRQFEATEDQEHTGMWAEARFQETLQLFKLDPSVLSGYEWQETLKP